MTMTKANQSPFVSRWATLVLFLTGYIRVRRGCVRRCRPFHSEIGERRRWLLRGCCMLPWCNIQGSERGRERRGRRERAIGGSKDRLGAERGRCSGRGRYRGAWSGGRCRRGIWCHGGDWRGRFQGLGLAGSRGGDCWMFQRDR